MCRPEISTSLGAARNAEGNLREFVAATEIDGLQLQRHWIPNI
jgi:hypothetical protein